MAKFTIRGLTHDGHAPQTLRDEITGMIQAAKPAPVEPTPEIVTISTGTVSIGDKLTATFEVTGDVTYADGVTWLGGKPPAGFRGVVALSRSTGGTVLGAWGAIGVTTSTPVTPAPLSSGVTPAPAPGSPPPAAPTPPPVSISSEAVTWNMAWSHNGWVVSGKTLARYFREPDGGWVTAWEYPRENNASWTPVPSTAPTYKQQQPQHKAVAKGVRGLGEGDAWIFTTKRPLADKDSVFVANDDSGAKIVVANGKYSYGNRVPQDGTYGTPGVSAANGYWGPVEIKGGDRLEIKRSEGYAIGSVIRENGQREQIFAFKFDWRDTTVAGVHGWNFEQIKAEVSRV